jgi:hypothetical protein
MSHDERAVHDRLESTYGGTFVQREDVYALEWSLLGVHVAMRHSHTGAQPGNLSLDRHSLERDGRRISAAGEETRV